MWSPLATLHHKNNKRLPKTLNFQKLQKQYLQILNLLVNRRLNLLAIENKATYLEERIVPPEVLTGLISHFYTAQNRGHTTTSKTLAPSYQMMLIFNFGAPAFLSGSREDLLTGQTNEIPSCIKPEKYLIIGPVKRALDYRLSPGAQILVVNFVADGFYRLFGALPPAGTGLHLAMTDQSPVPACFSDLWQALSDLPCRSDQRKRVDYLAQYCLPYIRHADPDIAQLKTLQAAHLDPIKATAFKTGKSERRIQQLHKKQLGSSAKELVRFQRFIHALQLLDIHSSCQTSPAKPDWFDIVVTCGYYDQSQLIHDFKHFMGLSPSKYLKFQNSICRS